jgi:hypothetical protein
MRLAAEECKYVMPLIRGRLEELYDARLNFDEALLLFRVLWRYRNPYPGRPLYPEPVTGSTIRELLGNGPFNEEGAAQDHAEEVVPGGVGGDLLDEGAGGEEAEQ